MSIQVNPVTTSPQSGTATKAEDIAPLEEDQHPMAYTNELHRALHAPLEGEALERSMRMNNPTGSRAALAGATRAKHIGPEAKAWEGEAEFEKELRTRAGHANDGRDPAEVKKEHEKARKADHDEPDVLPEAKPAGQNEALNKPDKSR